MFNLRKPIDLEVRRKDNAVLVEYRPLNLEGYGRSERQALESFADQFANMWHWVACAGDEILDGDTRHLKSRMLALVASVSAP